MNDCVRIFKTFIKSEEHNYYQNLAKTYNKTYSTISESDLKVSAGSNSTSTASNSILAISDNTNSFSSSGSNSSFSNTNNSFNGELIKEKVLKWFFSLPLESRIKVATVENAFITCMIHQMYFRYKCDTKIIFQFKPDTSSDDNSTNNSNVKEKYIYKVGPEANYCTEEDLYQMNILNHLNFKSNRTDSTDALIENIWLGDVRFYTVHTELDSMTVSPRVLKDEGLFNYYFKYIGNPKSFFSFIKPQFDPKIKQHSYHFPDWIDPKEFYTVGQFIAAHIEQAILVKYVLNFNRKDKFVYSLHNDKKMGEFFQKRKEVIGCLNKHFHSTENKKDLFLYISPRKIFNEVAYDKSIEKLISLKNRHIDVGYQTFVSRKFTAGKTPCFYGTSDTETENKIINKFLNENNINFVDDAIYHGIDNIWKENYFLSTKLFEYLHCVYTDKNYEELVNDMVVSEETRKNSTKKGKKNSKSSLDKDTSVPLSGSVLISSINKNNNNSLKKTKSINKSDILTSVVSLSVDPDYEYYSSYLREAKSQHYAPSKQSNNNNTNNKYNSNSNSNSNNEVINIDSSPAPKQECKPNINKEYVTDNKETKESIENKDIKGYLYDSYQNVKKKIITDFVKNYILKEIIYNAGDLAKKNNLDKFTSYNELLNDMRKISTKSKMINNYLNDKKTSNEQMDHTYINNITRDELIFGNLNQKEETITLSVSNNLQIDLIKVEDIKIEIDDKEDRTDTVNYIEKETQTPNTNDEEVSFQENKSNLENQENINSDQENSSKINNLGKKKKKEQNFFLYDTSKKKRGAVQNKTQNTTQSNVNTSEVNTSNANITNNYTQISNSQSQSKRNSAEAETIKPKDIPKDIFRETPKDLYTNYNNNNNNNNNNNDPKFKPNVSPNTTYSKVYSTNAYSNYNSNHHYSNNNYTSNHKHSNYYYKEGDDSRKEHSKYKGNNYNRYYKQNKASKNDSGNNYYIFNSVTHVTGGNNTNNTNNTSSSMVNPMNMYTPNSARGSFNQIPTPVSNMSNLVSNINMNKYSNDFLTYVYKLHNDIVSYHRNVAETLESMKEIKVCIIQTIEKLIKQNISDSFSIDIYGSFASDLAIESSDIDIKIRLKSCQSEDNWERDYLFDLENIIMLLVKNFNSLNLFESIIPIYTASVPIIKIIADPSNLADDDNLMRLEEFRNSENYKNYKFEKEEIQKIKIDLTFLDMVGISTINNLANNSLNSNNNNNNNNNCIMSSVEFAKNKLILYPEIKPLLQVLKRFLQIKNLNSCFNGGLSSFCLFLLILAFIKFKLISQSQVSQNNLGRLLLDFLEFYGRMFNFHGCTIDVNLANPFVLNNDIYDKSPVILDPLSYLNAAKSSFKIDEVKECFAEALDYLNMIKLKYDKIDFGASNSNIIYDLLLTN